MNECVEEEDDGEEEDEDVQGDIRSLWIGNNVIAIVTQLLFSMVAPETR